ncbi:uncharacterized protein B0T15DRAFT_215122 [Chaetomium strumarium]|uniref:Nephrocystin 3-like N-terminal domain-containing protein n=1 Tax=Chaetomium strumarium TaxID=1170767 RepID=A0AAJ0GTQ5_9PEZI|nr:hypothetical protein B0T15DRAFT_215122 [Chaetomium strumarium]
MPQARVLCFQYNGLIGRAGARSVVNIRSLATALLYHIDLHRCQPVEASRPIIFVGHSLGGVIIKQAFTLAHNESGRYKHLAEATCGIMFFATPHRSALDEKGRDYAERLLIAVGTYGLKRRMKHVPWPRTSVVEPTPRMLQGIQRHSGNLLTYITTDFLNKLAKTVTIVNFIEENETEWLKTAVVSDEEADLDQERADSQYLAGDHIGICKFSAGEDEHFRTVHESLKRMAEEPDVHVQQIRQAMGSTETRQSRVTPNELLRSLCTDDFHRYSSNIHPTKGTGRWIEEKPAFQAFQQGAEPKLWIYGEPATGKTYLAKHITNSMRIRGNVRVLECFLDVQKPARNSCEAILRSTIHQVARGNPALSARIGTAASTLGSRNWTLESLTELWPQVMTEAVELGGNVVIVLDGFDGIPPRDQEVFLDSIEQYEQRVSTRFRPSLRILILSRWCPTLDAPKRGFTAYQVQECDTKADIRTTVKRELSLFAHHCQYSEQFQETLCDAIAEGAKGIYLWATVMIADIEIWMPGEDQLRARLQRLPRTLAELYDSILGSICSRGDEYAKMAKRVLLWVVFSLDVAHPLTLQELNVGIALAGLWRPDSDRQITNEMVTARLIRSGIFKAVLYRVCGQLLRISSHNHVEPVHRTLSQYLKAKPEFFEQEHPDWLVPHHRHFHLPEHESHADLGGMCVAYLTMPSFAASGAEFVASDKGRAEWETKLQARIDNYELVRYSALCWLRHHALARDHQNTRAAGQPQQNANTLRDISTDFGISWRELWWYVMKWPEYDFPGRSIDLDPVILESLEPKDSLRRQTSEQEVVAPRRSDKKPAEEQIVKLIPVELDSTKHDAADDETAGLERAEVQVPRPASAQWKAGPQESSPKDLAELERGELKTAPELESEHGRTIIQPTPLQTESHALGDSGGLTSKGGSPSSGILGGARTPDSLIVVNGTTPIKTRRQRWGTCRSRNCCLVM